MQGMCFVAESHPWSLFTSGDEGVAIPCSNGGVTPRGAKSLYPCTISLAPSPSIFFQGGVDPTANSSQGLFLVGLWILYGVSERCVNMCNAKKKIRRNF